jgi:CspA family cold shock protein
MSDQVILYGSVIWFNVKSGIGFIKQDSSDKDIFVHYTGIAVEGFKTLYKDQKVSYAIGSNLKGQPIAVNVQVIK